MLLLRKVFFYLFLFIYLTLCPVIILYAFGFIFKPDMQEPVVRMGLIHLSTLPPGGSIYVDGVKNSLITPTTIQGLQSGDYTVKIELEGYMPWSHTIPVVASKASVFNNILLIPKQRNEIQILEENFYDIIPLLGTQFIILKKSPHLRDYSVYDCQNKTIFPLLAPNAELKDARVISVYSMAESTALLFYVEKGPKKSFILAKIEGVKPTFEDITDLFPEMPEQIAWSSADSNDIFSFGNGYLNRLDIKAEALYPRYVENTAGYGLFNNKLYVLDNDYSIVRMNFDKTAKETLLDDAALGRSLFSGKGYIDIEPVTDDIILFISKKGELITNHLPYRLSDEGVRGIDFYSDNELLLMWQKDRIGVVDFLTEETRGVVFEKGPQIVWVDVDGIDIKQAFWAYNGSHIVYLDKDEVSIIEFEEFGKPHLDGVVKVKKNTNIFYLENTGTLYYLKPPRGEFSSIKIVQSTQESTGPKTAAGDSS